MVWFCHCVVKFGHYTTRLDGYVLCFHNDVLRSSSDVLCLYFLCCGSFMRSIFSLCVIINTASKRKTSTHHDGNTTRNQQTLSHNRKTSPHNNIAAGSTQ